MMSLSESASPTIDRAMLAVSGAAFVAGVVGYHWAGDQPLLSAGLLAAGVALALVVGLLSPSGRRFVGFAREAQQEARKVHWPTRKETLQTTGIVFLFVLVMAIFLWITDKSLEWLLYDVLLGWKR